MYSCACHSASLTQPHCAAGGRHFGVIIFAKIGQRAEHIISQGVQFNMCRGGGGMGAHFAREVHRRAPKTQKVSLNREHGVWVCAGRTDRVARLAGGCGGREFSRHLDRRVIRAVPFFWRLTLSVFLSFLCNANCNFTFISPSRRAPHSAPNECYYY
jgi:hypothetical protein